MAELTQEQYEQVPEFLQGDYERVGDIYQHKAEGKAAALKSSMNDLNSKYKTAEGRISDIETQRQADIEAAKQQALEDARKSGDWESGEKRYQEMLDDANKRSDQALADLQGKFDSLSEKVKVSKKESILANLRGELGVFDESAKIFDRFVGPMIDVDPTTDKKTFFDDDGSATSLDLAGFAKSLSEDSAFSHMRRGQPTGTGGLANGSSSTGGAPKSLKDMTVTERVEYANKYPTEYAQQIGA